MARSWSELTKLTQGANLVVNEVAAPGLGVTLRGEWELPRLAELNPDDQVFVAAFLKTEGKIKDMEQLFGVSYPTIKNRLARINEQLHMVELNPPDSRGEILAKVERGELTAAESGREAQEMMLYVRVQGFGIWMPLFLLWPFALFAAFVLGLFVLRPFEATDVVYNILQSLRGLDVDVDQPGNRVQLSVR